MSGIERVKELGAGMLVSDVAISMSEISRVKYVYVRTCIM